MDWSKALTRAEFLASKHRETKDLLRFGRAVLRFQQEIYRRVRSSIRADARRPDTSLLAAFLPDFLLLAEKYGPGTLSAQAQKLRDRQDWEEILLDCWRQTEGPLQLLPRSILQPYVQYLSERWHVEVGVLEEGSGSCPFCGRAPLLSIRNSCRMLVCSLCAHEWSFPEGKCPGCHEGKLVHHRRRRFPNLDVEACEACGHYLKGVDLRKDAQAFPLVDELASVELDAMARDHGFVKFELNLAGQ